MSAYLCMPEFVAALATMTAQRTDQWGDAATVANRLALANLKSVAYRYHQTEDAVAQDAFGVTKAQYIRRTQHLAANPRRDWTALPRAEAQDMVACFAYQACEFPGWPRSRSVKICQFLHQNL